MPEAGELWTPNEDETLVQLYRIMPRRWRKISGYLALRSSAACRRRYQDYLRDYDVPFSPAENEMILLQGNNYVPFWEINRNLRQQYGRRRPTYMVEQQYLHLAAQPAAHPP